MTYRLARMPRITAGPGARAEVGVLTAACVNPNAPVLLVADPGLPAGGLAEEVAASLRQVGLAVTLFDAFGGDPAAAAADAAAGVARSIGAKAVVSLGGGSALDLGKTVAAIAAEDRPALAYELDKQPFGATRLASIGVPTTSGTGSELTRTAVLTRDDKAKVWLWGDVLKVDEVILDPEATLTLPASLTASTGLDALVHALEAATNAKATPANNLYAHEAMRLVAAHLERAVAHGEDLEAREALQRAAALAGVAIDNCGTAVAHTIGHALGSLGPIHHGRAVALGMIATLTWNVGEDDGRFAAAATAIGLRSVRDLPTWFEGLTRASGIEIALGHAFADITPQRLAEQMARPENAAMRQVNRRRVTDADLLAFANTVLTQR